MLTQCLFAFLWLAVVMLGILVMLPVLSLEAVVSALRRGLVMLLLGFLAFWILKIVLLPILTILLVVLKQVILRVLVLGVAMIVAVLLVRAIVFKLRARLPRAVGSQDGGER